MKSSCKLGERYFTGKCSTVPSGNLRHVIKEKLNYKTKKKESLSVRDPFCLHLLNEVAELSS